MSRQNTLSLKIGRLSLAAVPIGRATDPGAPILGLDPDLGRDITEEDWEEARDVCRGRLIGVPRGRWEPPAHDGSDAVGFLVLRGMLCRELSLAAHCMLELLGPGDVFQRPIEVSDSRLAGITDLTAVTETEVVALGDSFIVAAARWPTLLTAVQRRLEAQRQDLAVRGLIAHFSGADDRLLLMLWHLTERWGIVTAEGFVLPLALTHEFLGQLIHARRPTTTLALNSLATAGIVRRLEDGAWLLTPAVERRIIDVLSRTGAAGRTLGEQLMLSQLTTQTVAESRASRAQARQTRWHRARHEPSHDR